MLQNILNELNKHGNIKLSAELYTNIHEFKEKKEVHSMESVALVLSGHAPIYKYVFSETRLKDFCEANNIKYNLLEYEQELHLKIDNNYNSYLYEQ